VEEVVQEEVEIPVVIEEEIVNEVFTPFIPPTVVASGN
jgi:hypothetical protein